MSFGRFLGEGWSWKLAIIIAFFLLLYLYTCYILSNEQKREKAEKLLSGTLENLMSALTLLEFQDIMAQRLLRIKGFLSDVEKSILRIVILAGIEEIENERKEDLQKKLEELEWKKEVSQDEVDEITEDQEVDIKTARKQAHKEAYSDSPRKIILLYPDDTYETYDPR
jgi:hypothetical protein